MPLIDVPPAVPPIAEPVAAAPAPLEPFVVWLPVGAVPAVPAEPSAPLPPLPVRAGVAVRPSEGVEHAAADRATADEKKKTELAGTDFIEHVQALS